MDHKEKYTHNIRVSECYEYIHQSFLILNQKADMAYHCNLNIQFPRKSGVVLDILKPQLGFFTHQPFHQIACLP